MWWLCVGCFCSETYPAPWASWSWRSRSGCLPRPWPPSLGWGEGGPPCDPIPTSPLAGQWPIRCSPLRICTETQIPPQGWVHAEEMLPGHAPQQHVPSTLLSAHPGLGATPVLSTWGLLSGSGSMHSTRRQKCRRVNAPRSSPQPDE